MIDIKILRTTPEIVEKALHDKAIKGVDIKEVQKLDAERLSLGQELETFRAERNEISKGMTGGKPSDEMLEKAKALKEKIQTLEEKFNAVEEAFLKLYKKIPNIPTADTPV